MGGEGFVDPVTGDRLTAGERVSWGIQRLIRRWAFIGAVQLITAICWLIGVWHPEVLTWWNLAASDFAIIMEFLIGIAMLGQTVRDALVSRAVRRMEQEHGEQLRVQGQQIAELHALLMGKEPAI